LCFNFAICRNRGRQRDIEDKTGRIVDLVEVLADRLWMPSGSAFIGSSLVAISTVPFYSSQLVTGGGVFDIGFSGQPAWISGFISPAAF